MRAKNLPTLCPWCGRIAPPHGGVLPLNITDTDTGMRIRLVWHTIGCLTEDPLHMELADILSGDAPITDAYERLLERLRPRGLLIMQRTVRVTRDPDNPAITGRTPDTEYWGRVTKRRCTTQKREPTNEK